MGAINDENVDLKGSTFSTRSDLRQRISRIGPWLTCVALVLFIVLVAANENRHRRQTQADVRAAAIEKQEDYVVQGSKAVGDYLTNVLMEMQLIGQLVRRSQLDTMLKETIGDTIEIIARHNVERDWITELYVVERDFTGEEKPIAVYEFNKGKIESRGHGLAVEKDEYAEIYRQMQVYAGRPEVGGQLSHPLKLCTRQLGLVLTIPIKSPGKPGKLLGLVAAMIPVNQVLKLAAHFTPIGQSEWWIVGQEGLKIGSPAGSFPELDSKLDPRANGESSAVTIEKDGLVVSASATEVAAIGRLTVVAALSGEKLSRLAVQEVGGPWSFRLLGTLAIGFLLGLCLILLFRYWQKQSEHFRSQSERDSLTGLYSRRKLDQICEALARDKAEMATLLIDLNNFKEVNDSLGHGTGDQVLQAVANLLHRCLRQTDMVLRIGGDEFVVLLSNPDRPTMIMVMERIREAAEQWNLGNRIPGAKLSLAIGGAIGPAERANSVIGEADAQMYLDKTDSRK